LQVYSACVKLLLKIILKSKFWPLMKPFQCHLTCSISRSKIGFYFPILTFYFKLGVKLLIGFMAIHLAITLHSQFAMAITNKLSMFMFKTISMTFWGITLDHVYYLHFCHKYIWFH
jgi:hypothetical protein